MHKSEYPLETMSGGGSAHSMILDGEQPVRLTEGAVDYHQVCSGDPWSEEAVRRFMAQHPGQTLVDTRERFVPQVRKLSTLSTLRYAIGALIMEAIPDQRRQAQVEEHGINGKHRQGRPQSGWHARNC